MLSNHPNPARAVGLEYQDAAPQLNAAAQRAEEAAGPPEEWTEAQLPPLAGITGDGVRAALLQVQQMLHVQGGGGGGGTGPAEATPEALHQAHAMLETCVLPALAELAKQQRGGAAAAAGAAQQGAAPAAAAASQHVAVGAMLAQYPLGFSTGDGSADLAATILRMLYIKDLRTLQVGGGGPCGCLRCLSCCFPPPRHAPTTAADVVQIRPIAPADRLRLFRPHPCSPVCPPPPAADAGRLGDRAGAGVYSQPPHRRDARQSGLVAGSALLCQRRRQRLCHGSSRRSLDWGSSPPQGPLQSRCVHACPHAKPWHLPAVERTMSAANVTGPWSREGMRWAAAGCRIRRGQVLVGKCAGESDQEAATQVNKTALCPCRHAGSSVLVQGGGSWVSRTRRAYRRAAAAAAAARGSTSSATSFRLGISARSSTSVKPSRVRLRQGGARGWAAQPVEV